jgi:hypothetical protein
MHRRQLLIAAVMLATVFGASGALAQDQGIPDTIRVGVADVDQGDHFSVPITMFNDDPVEAVSLGFWWDTPHLFLDSISWIGSSAIHIATRLSDVDNVDYNVLIGVIKIFEPPIQPGDSLLATMWFTAQPTAPDTIITIDSGFVPPAGVFKINIGQGFEGYAPQYQEGSVTIGEPPPPPVFSLSSNEFLFEAFEGGSNPPPQVLEILNSGGQTLNWTATWDAPWLDISPPSGTAPSSVSIIPDIATLTEGTYVDTVTFEDPNATNSPQLVVVTLDVIIPPPVIELVPDHFEFTAQQDSANPDPQTMQINDIGAGTLSWTASNSQPWLTLSEYSGTAGAEVDLMVDITGMMFGTYYDSIVVEDPAATNSPQIATVVLTIYSGTPVLAVDPDSFYCAATPGTDPYERPIIITNEGGDYLVYTITSKKGYMSFDPDSGAVVAGSPDTSMVTFSAQSLSFGFHWDTVVVSAPGAQKAVHEIETFIWMMENPPILEVSPPEILIEAYECYNWPPLTPAILQIDNTGGEDLNWTIYGVPEMPDWLSFLPPFGPDDQAVQVIVDVTDLPTGVYNATIAVVPEFSLNPPETLDVTMTLIEQTADPIVGVSQDHFEFLFKAGQVSTAEQPIQITNLASGCMDWYVTESQTWLDVEPDTGHVPAQAWVGVNGFGLPLGKTTATFKVNAVGYPASFAEVTVDLYVWTWGDADCSGGEHPIDIDDVVYLVEYIFLEGPEPCPRRWVGDVDCTHGDVDIDDVVYLIAWIFSGGPEPCDWPGPIGTPQVPATHTFLDMKKTTDK